MSDKTDVQALTEQMQVLTSSVQELSKNVADMKSQGTAQNTTQVIRPSDFSAKVSLIPAAVLSFVFSAFGIVIFTCTVLEIRNNWTWAMASAGGLICSYFFTKYWYKNLAKKPMVNIDTMEANAT